VSVRGLLFSACTLLSAIVCAGTESARPPRVSDLKCEYLRDPVGVDISRPRLSWIVRSPLRGERQIAYRIQAASGRRLLAGGTVDLWDTGRVESGRSVNVVYRGKTLSSRLRCWWRVKVWGGRGGESPWSGISFWEMGLLRATDWKAKWIDDGKPLPARAEDFYRDDPAPLFRKAVFSEEKVKRARLYVSGLGYYEAFLNGKRIGDCVLDPLWTTYSKRVFYRVYDVGDLLENGENVLAATLGNGWYNPLPLRMWGRFNLREALTVGRPRLLAQLEIEYEDGSRKTVVTDESWKTAEGPIIKNSVYLGETYDARREIAGWSKAGFDDSAWRGVRLCDSPLGRLRWEAAPPIRIVERLRAVRVTEPRPGVFIFDLGRNFAGWVRLKVKGPRGTKVRMRFGELLYPDGTLNVMTSVCGQIKRAGLGGPGAPEVAFQADTYILKGGGGVEVFTPHFTFHGFRYAEVTGYPGRPHEDAVTGLVLCCDLERTGAFECSNPSLNRIQKMIVDTFRSNLFGVQSDCPHREKFGYGGDIVAARHAFLFNFDMAAFYAKAVRDFADAARPNGSFTETAPYVGIADGGFGGGSGPIGWAIAHPLLLEDLYRFYGDERIVREEFEAAKKWLDFVKAETPDMVVKRGISDHESLVPKPVSVTGTAFFHQGARTLAFLARVLGRREEARELAGLASRIRNVFRKRFVNAGTGTVFKGTQACQAAALYHGLPADGERVAVFSALLERIRADGGKLTTGIFGTKYLLDVLSRNGAAETAYRIVTHEEFPGWIHMLRKGATTLWEHWKFSDNIFSHNHPMFGSVGEWFFRHLAGIDPCPEARALERIVIRPRVAGDLKWVKARYDSARGRISSSWSLEDGGLSLRVEIPVGVTARVFLPLRGEGEVTESGRPAAEAPGVKEIARKREVAVFEIGSGEYLFRAPYEK